MNRDAFNAGFIAKLADSGYTPTEFNALLEKSAGWGLPSAGGLAAILAGLGFLSLGGLGWASRFAGSKAQKLTEPTERDLSIAKKEEELEEYKSLISEARRRAETQLSSQTAGTV